MMDLQVYYTLRRRTLERKTIDSETLNKRLGNLDSKALFSDLSISNNWESFKTTLSDTVLQYTTISTFKRSLSKPWINGRILNLVCKEKALWRAFKRTGTKTSYNAHRAFSNHLLTTIKEARLVYEERIAEDRDSKTLFKHIRTTLSGPVKAFKVKDAAGTVNDDSYTVADIGFTLEPLSGMTRWQISSVS